MNRSESIKNLAPALLKVQRVMGNAQKGASNPYFKSTYADLNSVRETALPVLNANNITCLQPTVENAGKNYVETILIHETGEWLSSFTEIKNTKGDAQTEGSGISYARRYGLQSLLNIGAVDDDAESTMKRDNSTKAEFKAPVITGTPYEVKKKPGRPANASKAAVSNVTVTTTSGPGLSDNKTTTTTVTKLPTKVANGYSGNSTHDQIINEDEW